MYVRIVAVGHGRPWVVDDVEGLGEAPDAVRMMLLGQHQTDGFASGKHVQ